MNKMSIEVEKLETLIEINALINSQYQDVSVLLSRIMESAERLIGTDASALLLVDMGTNLLYFEIALGEKGEDVKRYKLKMGEGIAGWVAQNDRSLLVNEAENDARHYSAISDDTGYRTRNLLAVPMRAKDKLIGVLEVINKTENGLFDDNDLKLLEVLADQASIAIQNAHEFGRMTHEIARLESNRSSDEEASQFIWESPVTGKILEQAERVAGSDSSILILGESGTGKELLAEYVHRASRRNTQPLIKVNCAAIPQELIESELFGYVKGSFTDATRDKLGYFERADTGTLFLDEVAELSSAAQGKLLRVLNSGWFQRVGGEIDVAVDVRVIAATNKNLDAEVEGGRFRQDLYYRLAVLPLEIPPLRDRPGDIEVLARHFLNSFRESDTSVPEDFDMDAIEALLSHRWPGNVRELRNAIERGVIHSRGQKTVNAAGLALSTRLKNGSDYRGKNLKDSVSLFKKNFIREILIAHNGNQTQAAEVLGIQRTYLSRIIKELNIAIGEDE